MMPTDVKELLTRKVGPLPVWAWIGAGVGGVLVARWISGRSGTAALPGDATGTLGDSLIPADSGSYYTPRLPEPISVAEPIPLEPSWPAEPIWPVEPQPVPCPQGFASDGAGGCVELPPAGVACPPGFASDGAGGCIELPTTGGGGGAGGGCDGTKPNRSGRACDRGYHLVKIGKCKGRCVKNRGAQAAASSVAAAVVRVVGPRVPDRMVLPDRSPSRVPIPGPQDVRGSFPASLGASALPISPVRITAFSAFVRPPSPSAEPVPSRVHVPERG